MKIYKQYVQAKIVTQNLIPGLRDLSLQKFSKLTVIKPIGLDKNGSPVYFCSCECGRHHLTKRYNLTTGRHTSCGCDRTVRKGFIAHNRIPDEQFSCLNAVYLSYKKQSSRLKVGKNVEFSLNKFDVESLIFRNCYYCGSEPSNVYRRLNKTYNYNGIDRKDSNIGYTIDNCVPCCKKCNFMKGVLNFNEFVNQIIKIYSHII